MSDQSGSDKPAAGNESDALRDKKEWMELAKISLDEFKNRREFEWKLAFGFWTAIAAFTYMLVSTDRCARS